MPTVFLCYNILHSQQYDVSFPIFPLPLTSIFALIVFYSISTFKYPITLNSHDQCPTVFLCYNILYSQQYNVSFPIFPLPLTFHICFDSVLFHFNFQVSNYPKFLRPMLHCISLLQYSSFPAI